jgi:hypothetical protein
MIYGHGGQIHNYSSPFIQHPGAHACVITKVSGTLLYEPHQRDREVDVV